MSENQEQLPLWPLVNPMHERFPREFFKQIPQRPGIYWFLNERGEIIYVGKAKSLRDRIRTYRLPGTARAPGKTARLVRQIHDIGWEVCGSEEEAWLLENDWLRRLKPRFNTANTRPEIYAFLGLRQRDESRLEFFLQFDLQEIPQDAEVFGAFKGVARVPQQWNALLRRAWAAARGACDWPAPLLRHHAPRSFNLAWEDREFSPVAGATAIADRVRRLLGGHDLWLDQGAPPDASAFLTRWWQEDAERLERLFFSAQKLRLLREGLEHADAVVAQERLDDLLVINRMRAARSPGPRPE